MKLFRTVCTADGGGGDSSTSVSQMDAPSIRCQFAAPALPKIVICSSEVQRVGHAWSVGSNDRQLLNYGWKRSWLT
jgi:hypothetical protein